MGRGLDSRSSKVSAGRYADRSGSAWQDLKSGRSRQSAVVEDEAIRLLIHYPQEASAWLHRSLFADSTRRAAFDVLQEAESVIEAGELASERVARLIHRLATDPGDAPAADVLARIAGLAAPRAMDELRRCAASSSDAALRQEYIHCFTWLNKQVEFLLESSTRDAALIVLMPWLIEHGRRSEAARRLPGTEQPTQNAGGEDRDAGVGDVDWDAVADGVGGVDRDAVAGGEDRDAVAGGVDWDAVADGVDRDAGAAMAFNPDDVSSAIASFGEIASGR